MRFVHDYVLTGIGFKESVATLVRDIGAQRVLSIRAADMLGHDIDKNEHLVRSARMAYTVSYPDGTTHRYQRMVRLVNAIAQHAPMFVPDLYYILAYEYIAGIDETLYTATLHALDLCSVRPDPPDRELELFHETQFAETIAELVYRELFYEMHILQGEHYTLATFPLRRQLDRIYLYQNYKNRMGLPYEIGDDTDETGVEYCLLRRYMFPARRPVWSRKRYGTLLHNWAQVVDTLCETLRR